MNFFLPLLIQFPRWLLFWCYSKWNYCPLAVLRLYHRRTVTELWKQALPHESPVLCSPRGQGRSRSSTRLSACMVTLESHGTPEYVNEGYYKIQCVNVLLCSNVLQVPNAKVPWIHSLQIIEKRKASAFQKENTVFPKEVQFWPPVRWCRMENSAWTSFTG